MKPRKYQIEFEVHNRQPQVVMNDIIFMMGREHPSVRNLKITKEVWVQVPYTIELWAFTQDEIDDIVKYDLFDVYYSCHSSDSFDIKDVNGNKISILRNGVVESEYAKHYSYEFVHPQFSLQPAAMTYYPQDPVVTYRKTKVDDYGYFAGFVEEQ